MDYYIAFIASDLVLLICAALNLTEIIAFSKYFNRFSSSFPGGPAFCLNFSAAAPKLRRKPAGEISCALSLADAQSFHGKVFKIKEIIVFSFIVHVTVHNRSGPIGDRAEPARYQRFNPAAYLKDMTRLRLIFPIRPFPQNGFLFHGTGQIYNPFLRVRQEVGETLQFIHKETGIYYPENNTPAVDMKIIGIFDAVADKDDQINMYDDASYYDFSNYIFCSMKASEGLIKGWGEDGDGISEAYYYVSDAAQLERVIEKVQSISSIDWNSFKITANNQVYQNISSSLSDTGTLITTLIVVITVVSMVLISLILSMSIHSRKQEIGVLLAVRTTKPLVILQYVIETLLIAIAAFPLAYLTSRQIAGTLGTLFDKAAESVIVTPRHFVMVTIVGAVLLIAAVMVSCIPVMRLKPKTILSQME